VSTALTTSPAAPAPEKTAAAGEAKPDDPRWRHVLDLACLLTAELPIPGFTVADLLKLRGGSVIRTQWRVTQDIPVRVNGTLVAWAELEGAGKRLSVRLTEMA
jgi:flagellar motor switch/type III secretory pathway protein FliN